MQVEIGTLVLIARRLEQAAIPRFFDDRWSPRRVRARRERFDRWLGPLGRALVAEASPGSRRRLQRQGGAALPPTRALELA